MSQIYKFVADISERDFCGFTEKFSFAPIFQTPAWAHVKSGWTHTYFAVTDEDGNICGAAMMLIRKLAPSLSFGYCPRGPLLDFENKELLEAFTSGLKQYAKSHGLCYIKVDPLIPCAVTKPEIKENLYFDPYSGNEEHYKASFDALIAAGYTHKGFGKILSDYIQPRFNTLVPLKNAEGKHLSPDELKKNFRPSIRKYVGSFSDNRGIFSEMPEITDEVLETFARLIHSTETRQGIYLRGKEYFGLLTEAFGDRAKILFAKCKVPVYKAYLEQRLQNEPENAEKIKEQIAEADGVIAERGEVVPLAGMLIVFPDNTQGVKVAEYLYTGADLSVFSAFHITLSGLYDAMNFCIEKDIDLLDLGGVEGSLDDGLYEFKSKFCPILNEYYGEFDLVVKPFKYKLLEKYLPSAVRIYKKITRAFSRKKDEDK